MPSLSFLEHTAVALSTIPRPRTPNPVRTAVIGAGVSGLTTALTLARAGYPVTLFDRSSIPARNTSAIAGGMLAPFSESDILPSSYILAGLEGIRLWRDLLGPAHVSCLNEYGSLVVGHPDHLEALLSLSNAVRSLSDERIVLDGPGIVSLEPDLSPYLTSGVYLPGEAHLMPERALSILFDQFTEAGGLFEVKEVAPEALLGVFDYVVDCRGFLPGIAADLSAIQGEIITVHQPAICLTRPVRRLGGPAPFYIVPRPLGEFAIGATAIADPVLEDWRVRVTSVMDLLAFATDLLPGLKTARIVGMNSGLRAAYPHLLPEIRRKASGQLIQINGLYRHGYLLAPVMAASVVAMLDGKHDRFEALFSGRLNIPPVALVRDTVVKGCSPR